VDYVATENFIETHSKGTSSSPWRNLLLDALRAKAFLNGEQQCLLDTPGKPLPWFLDVKGALLEATALEAWSQAFWDRFCDKLHFQVGGLEVGAIPLLSAILMKAAQQGYSLTSFIVRRERKPYGAGNLIDGALSDLPIVIVDDFFDSGKSLDKVRAVLAHEGRQIAQVFVVVDFHSESGRRWKERYGIPVHSIFSLEDLGLHREPVLDDIPQAEFETEWSFCAPHPNPFYRAPKSFPLLADDRLYFGSDSGVFWCLQASDGAVVWSKPTHSDTGKGIWSSPAYSKGRVFFGAYDGNVYCLDAATGNEHWRFIGADWVGSSPALAEELGILFIGLEFGEPEQKGGIVALDMATGQKLWELKTKKHVHASPTYSRTLSAVACGSNDGDLFLLNATDGAMRWRFSTRGASEAAGYIRHAASFCEERREIVVGSADGGIYVIDAHTGKEVWSVETGNMVYTVPLILGTTAYVGSTDKYFYILDLAARKVVRKIPARAKIFSPARSIGGRIYFGACNGIVYEIDPDTYSITGRYQLPDAVTNAVCYSEERKLFYASTYVNEVYAFRRKAIS
jgi:orotate phosphoribosyltransferase